MAYWRMQVHHAVQALAAGFVGFGYRSDFGDLTLVMDPAALPQGQRDWLDFARRMAVADKVLMISHHYPFARATVEGDYNYIRTPRARDW